ncbi:MAG: methylenetetrahydrofolate reductase [Thermoplasmatota archaeon]
MISFRERLERDRFPVTYEVISPRAGDAEPYLKDFEHLPIKDRLAGVNITNNPSARVRCDPAAFGHLLLDHGVDPIPHITVRDMTLAGIQRWIFGAWALGMRNLVVMTGDHPKEGDYPEERRVDSLNAIELIAGIRKFLADGYLIPDVVSAGAARYTNRFNPPKPPKKVTPVHFFVGSPLVPWRNNEVEYARAKADAGAQFFQTQITWDATPILDFLAQAEERGALDGKTPVLVGCAPLRDPKTLNFLHTKIPLVKVPAPVQTRLAASKDFAWESVEVVVEMFEQLKDGARARGIRTKLGGHVLPINDNALASEIVRRIHEA